MPVMNEFKREYVNSSYVIVQSSYTPDPAARFVSTSLSKVALCNHLVMRVERDKPAQS